MSRIGKQPLIIPSQVETKITDSVISVKGPKGELKLNIHPRVMVNIDDNQISVVVKNQDVKEEKALWGLFASLIKNMLIGVTEGFSKKLIVDGIGYKVSLSGKVLNLNLGFSHVVNFNIPDDINITVEKNLITVQGIDKQRVGEVAAQIRALRKPEPYKGKGIKYSDEIIRKKAGKAAGAKGD